jgi:hypothetical protein
MRITRDQFIAILEKFGSHHDGEVAVSARKAHDLAHAEGGCWGDVIIYSEKQVEQELLFVDSQIRGLRNEDKAKFLQIREAYFKEGSLDIPDLRRLKYFKSLLARGDPINDIPF